NIWGNGGNSYLCHPVRKAGAPQTKGCGCFLKYGGERRGRKKYFKKIFWRKEKSCYLCTPNRERGDDGTGAMPGKVKGKTGSTGGETRWIRRRPKRERRRLKFFKKSDSCSVTGGLFFGESQKDRPERSVGRKIQKDRKAALKEVRMPRSET
ncbi:hypothetical protein, partial [Olivibacter jilunii]